MASLNLGRPAFGRPGIEPRWTRSAKDAVGTAYSASSLVWFTVSSGILNEIYYPTIDHPQVRDLQYLVTDGATFFHDERRHLDTITEYLDDHSLGIRIVNTDRTGRYYIRKEIIADPHQSCVLVHTCLELRSDYEGKIRLFALLAPHLGVGGWRNSAYSAEVAGCRILTARKGDTWLALAASIPFCRTSCGYVGASDGWTDLSRNLEMDWEFDCAEEGNVALTGELDLAKGREFTLCLAFGDGFQSAVAALLQALGFPIAEKRSRFVEQWERACHHLLPLGKASRDGGRLYRSSHSLLLAHEDKTYPGAMIASMSIPWGEAKGDEDLGGYHLVWTRDMVQSATGLLASGNFETPLRALIYLAGCQAPDGGFPQNFWIDGKPYWSGIQLDEVAFPILLAWRLREERALRNFDPYPMVLCAAGYLVRQGPATPQERWEENSGYSPATLASSIAALICAACFARERGDELTARFLEEYADFLECHVESWTVTSDGALVSGVRRHFIRIHPANPGDPEPDEDPNHGVLVIRNHPLGENGEYPAKDVVDAGFLELVRYGVRKPQDPLIRDSLRVVDALLRVETPFGSCWRRYNHDGYGQRDGGGPFQGWGKGRAWPLLTGERGHYELAAGGDPLPHLRTMELLATPTGLLPEQVWDEPDRAELSLYFGRPTGSAMPLMWAHAEYVKLLRSITDGRVFDWIPEVAARYLAGRRPRRIFEVWKFGRRVRTVKAGGILRIQAAAPFRLHWSRNEWLRAEDISSTPTVLGIEYVDLSIPRDQRAPIRFTFFWTGVDRWEGHDFSVAVNR